MLGQRSLPHNGSPHHWLLNPAPLKNPHWPIQKHLLHTLIKGHNFWNLWLKKEGESGDLNLDLGVMGRRRQKPCMLLGLSVLTVEMSSEEREAQPIFFCINGDEFSAWVWFYALREEKGKRRNNLREEQWEYNVFSLLNKKMFIRSKVSAFLKLNTHIPNTYFCFLNTQTCYLNHDTKHIFFFFLVL